MNQIKLLKKNKYLAALLFLLYGGGTFSQDIVSPSQTSEISYDHKTKKISGIFPFDIDFKFTINNLKTSEIQKGIIYEVFYKNGERDLKNHKRKNDTLIVFKKSDISKFKTDNKQSLKKRVFRIIEETEVKGTVFKLVYEKKIFKNGRYTFIKDSIVSEKLKTITEFKEEHKDSFEIGNYREISQSNYSDFIFRLIYSKIIADYYDLSFSPTLISQTTSSSFISPLEPEKLYEIAIFKNNSKSNILVYNLFFDEYRKLIRDGVLDSNDLDKLKNIFESKIAILDKSYVKRAIPVATMPKTINAFLNKMVAVTTYIENVGEPNTDCIVVYPNITQDLSYIGDLLYKKKIDITSYSTVLSPFLNQDKIGIVYFSEGIIKGVTKTYDYESKLINLKNNLIALNKVKTDIDKLRFYMNDNTVNNFYKNFLIEAIKKIKENIDIVNEYQSNIKGIINKKVPELVLISGATQNNDLKTVNSNTLIADIGLLNFTAFNSNGNTKFFLLKPVLGLNWHIGGINKSQPLNQIINKKFRHQCSLYFGLTLGGINTEFYEDLHGAISPILGINYRIARQIRLGTGTVFLREKNINPILDRNKVVLAPYLGISFDVGLFEGAKELIDKIK